MATPEAVEPLPRAASKRSKEHWILLAGSVCVLLGLLALGVLVEPDERGVGTHEKLGMAPCLPMAQWNFPCPGCGVTTSVSHAAHGDFWASFKNQPFGFVVALLFAAFVLWAPIAHFRGRDLWTEAQRLPVARWGKTLGVILVVAWVYKILLVRGIL